MPAWLSPIVLVCLVETFILCKAKQDAFLDPISEVINFVNKLPPICSLMFNLYLN